MAKLFLTVLLAATVALGSAQYYGSNYNGAYGGIGHGYGSGVSTLGGYGSGLSTIGGYGSVLGGASVLGGSRQVVVGNGFGNNGYGNTYGSARYAGHYGTGHGQAYGGAIGGGNYGGVIGGGNYGGAVGGGNYNSGIVRSYAAPQIHSTYGDAISQPIVHGVAQQEVVSSKGGRYY